MHGATLGCFIKGCSLCYHYLCAIDAGNLMLPVNICSVLDDCTVIIIHMVALFSDVDIF